MMRFVENAKAKREGMSVNVERLSVIEITSAERLWIKEVQSTIVQNLWFRKMKVHLGIAEIEGILVKMMRYVGVRVQKSGKGKIEFLNRHVQKLIPIECAGKNVQERKERKDEAEG